MPKTPVGARTGRAPPATTFNLHKHLAEMQQKMGMLQSPDGKKPGDIAWEGPCENGTRMVCRFDADMQPSICKPESC